jgi:hypothetical protein
MFTVDIKCRLLYLIFSHVNLLQTNIHYTNFILLNFLKVIHNKLHLDQALRACCLFDYITTQTLHYHVQRAKKKLTQSTNQHSGMVLELVLPPAGDNVGLSTMISPLTDSGETKSVLMSLSADCHPQHELNHEKNTAPRKRRRRRSAKQQARKAKFEAKQVRDDYDWHLNLPQIFYIKDKQVMIKATFCLSLSVLLLSLLYT